MCQNDIVCDDVGWCSGFKKGGSIIDDVDIGLRNIMYGMGTNNNVFPYHGSMIGYSIVVVDGGSIM